MSTVIAVAPGRVNLIGEHTDYNGGLCLPFAIGLGTTATLTTRRDRRLSIDSDRGEVWTGTWDDVVRQDVNGWAAYVAGVLWAMAEDGWEVPGLDIAITTTLPLGGGLSSSAALECSVALAVAALSRPDRDRDERMRLAEACRRAETEYVGAPTGGMDQLASLLATPDHGVLIDFADPTAPRVHDVELGFDAASLAVLVTDTGVRHALADGDGGYAQRRAECEAFAADPATSERTLAARGRHVRTESDRVRRTVEALRTRDWSTVGELMTASHASLRDDFEVSCAELDTSVDAALAAGASGARMTGGGFGGCSIALVARDDVDRVAAAIGRSYEARGWPAPAHHVVSPGAGARLHQ
ncbi:hypothetical protein ASE01_18105 [Nocardioides sp. Root190]|uniref:galactokinase n=1 Tax=Nocardioides sp. Root190 TaxID=1736488 RepID=UPI00070059DF|nr:galactokinase family protein [Nocardioides sp. Root190]KRB73917.1 hypothetical protein ASE01_18105 [Nocardioides sp. Root190]